MALRLSVENVHASYGVVRVLHNLSFIEDPTRILRAVRFEQRFGFTVEARTVQLIDDARNLLDKVSGQRLRHEHSAKFVLVGGVEDASQVPW